MSSERSAARPRTEGTLAPTQSEGRPAPDPHSCSISCHTGCDLSWACGAPPGGEGALSSPRECPNHGALARRHKRGTNLRAPEAPWACGNLCPHHSRRPVEPRPRASLSGAAAEMLMFAGGGQGHGRNPESLRGVSLTARKSWTPAKIMRLWEKSRRSPPFSCLGGRSRPHAWGVSAFPKIWF